LLPLTGPAAPVGAEQRRGVEYAIDKINAAGGIGGRKVIVLFEDSQAKPDVGILSFNRLVDLHQVPVVMTAFSSVSLAIAPLATRRKVVLVNAGAQSDKMGAASPYLFNTISLVREETGSLVKFVVGKLGKKTAGLVYENVAAGIDAKDDFKTEFEAAGGKVLDEEPVEFGQTNYRPTLLKVAAAKPDFVYFAVTQGHSTYIEQTTQIPNFPVGVGTTLVNPSFGSPGAVGWYQSAVRSTLSPELAEEFKAKSGLKDVSFFEREYFNATNIVLAAMERVVANKGTITGESVREAIFAIKTFKSSVADITFDKTNTAVRGIDIQQYTPTERKIISVE
jgi:branched-chain amino acid transport system substrate-binding protein